jgi:hypothetical protein
MWQTLGARRHGVQVQKLWLWWTLVGTPRSLVRPKLTCSLFSAICVDCFKAGNHEGHDCTYPTFDFSPTSNTNKSHTLRSNTWSCWRMLWLCMRSSSFQFIQPKVKHNNIGRSTCMETRRQLYKSQRQ